MSRSRRELVSGRTTPLEKARLELGYLEPIHRVVVQQLAKAYKAKDEEIYQRLGAIYNLLMKRQLKLVGAIAKIEGVPPCAECGSMASDWVKRKRGKGPPRLESQHCLECEVEVKM